MDDSNCNILDDKSKISINIKDEFKYLFKEENEAEDDFEKTLEKEIEKNCEFNIYVDKLEIEEKSEDDLQTLEKHDIINFKNYQIQKLKAYIYSLEKEKEDLIENFKNTTNVLLEKIKELEFNQTGIRPQTPFIANKLNKKFSAYTEERNNTSTINISKTNSDSNINNFTNNSNNFYLPDEKTKKSKNEEGLKFENSNNNLSSNLPAKKQRCVNCQKEFPQEIFLQHSLECLRNRIKCKKCNELIEEKNKKDHLIEWRSKEKIISAIYGTEVNLLQKCIDHGTSSNMILDDNTGDTILHYIAKNGEFRLLEVLLSTEINLDVQNNNKETPLVTAICERNMKIAKALIELGADISIRNSAHLTPLMISCKEGLTELAEILLSNDANINDSNILGDTSLKLAQRFGHEELALLLINKYRALIQNRPSTSVGKK